MFFLQKGNGLVDKLPVVGVETGHVGRCFHVPAGPAVQWDYRAMRKVTLCTVLPPRCSPALQEFPKVSDVHSDFLQDEGA